ncbi:peptidase inhibitor family I36 protein [Streptomyces sp. NPDC002668]|uniref:peptidase inhibitor family I36 protein n=1 Tax=Streptomyces sp. NPDC002668 TaxID=3154422 RepID=UPI0033248CFB
MQVQLREEAVRKAMMTLGAAAALALTSLTATQAQAATAAPAAGYDRCPNGYLCIFDGADGTGSMAWFRSGSPDLRGQGMDNRTNSVYNRTGGSWSLYDGYGYSGTCFFSIGVGAFNVTGSYNNSFSSLQSGHAC